MLIFQWPLFYQGVAVVHEIDATYTDVPTPADYQPLPVARVPMFESSVALVQEVAVAAANTQGVDENAEANHALHLFRQMFSWPAYYSIVVEGLPGSISATGIVLVYLPERTFTAEVRDRTLGTFLPERTLSVELREGGREKA